MTRGSRATSSGAPSTSIAPLTSTEMRSAKLKHQIHVVLDQQHRDVARQCRDGGKDIVALAFGNAGGGLVEQQHPRPGGDGDRDLQQALLAVRQRRRQFVHDVEQMEARQVLRDLAVDVVAGAHPAPPVAAAAEPFRHRKPDGLERRQVGIELVDLEGARQAAQHAACAPAGR